MAVSSPSGRYLSLRCLISSIGRLVIFKGSQTSIGRLIVDGILSLYGHTFIRKIIEELPYERKFSEIFMAVIGPTGR